MLFYSYSRSYFNEYFYLYLGPCFCKLTVILLEYTFWSLYPKLLKTQQPQTMLVTHWKKTNQDNTRMHPSKPRLLHRSTNRLVNLNPRLIGVMKFITVTHNSWLVTANGKGMASGSDALFYGVWSCQFGSHRHESSHFFKGQPLPQN